MGKKKLDVMAKEREVFIHGQVDEEGNIIVPGCVRNGIDEASANKIFDEMAEFAKYAFNKSHAAAYAVVSYRTAYLKAYYKEELMAATLNSFLGNLDKVPIYIEECKKLGIEILKPDINESDVKFTVKNGKIRFGLGSIKNVGMAVNAIVKERKTNGEFKDFVDFCERIQSESVNKKCIESLIKAGAFDSMDNTRHTLIDSFEIVLDTIYSSNKRAFENQVSMFDFSNSDDLKDIKYTFNIREEYSEKELLSMEKEMIGLYISGHPLDKLRDRITKISTINSMQLRNEGVDDTDSESSNIGIENQSRDGQIVKIVGIITGVKKKYTKNNTIMSFVTLEDLFGSFQVIVFDSVYNKCSDLLVEDSIVLIDGRVSNRDDDESTIIARSITDFGKQEVSSEPKSLIIDIRNLDDNQKKKLKGAIKFFSGDRANIGIKITDTDGDKPCGGVFFTETILNEFKEIVGNENVKIK